jgi:hypothetical protein
MYSFSWVTNVVAEKDANRLRGGNFAGSTDLKFNTVYPQLLRSPSVTTVGLRESAGVKCSVGPIKPQEISPLSFPNDEVLWRLEWTNR